MADVWYLWFYSSPPLLSDSSAWIFPFSVTRGRKSIMHLELGHILIWPDYRFSLNCLNKRKMPCFPTQVTTTTRNKQAMQTRPWIMKMHSLLVSYVRKLLHTNEIFSDYLKYNIWNNLTNKFEDKQIKQIFFYDRYRVKYKNR